ncbi:protein-L-isoaspartate O-methyltransferase family protein [Nigerium massiliense]|uniref:protein-L-isoaspartate O-methyltransferase family protein n=1 Tax=Nigerium massiliense TaxID=1522317 RepID=UPI000590762A|nr:methyltransferase domain-containing protein [Nigerium massiliense]
MDARVRAALDAAPRERFLRAQDRPFAHIDAPLSIGHGVTNSQPSTVFAMLELLDVRPGQRVLDVGAGSGWTTALLAELVGPSGRVVGVERIPELIPPAIEALTPWPQASVQLADDGVLGVPEAGPYDRILVSAMADDLPGFLVAQLVVEGVMVIPVRDEMRRVVRRAGGGTQVSEHGLYSFVPLIP